MAETPWAHASLSEILPKTLATKGLSTMIFVILAGAALISLGIYTSAIIYGNSNILNVLILSISAFPFSVILIRNIFQRSAILSMVFSFYYILFLIFPGSLHTASSMFPFYGIIYPSDEIFYAAIIIFLFGMGALAGHSIVPAPTEQPYVDRPNIPQAIVVATPAASIGCALLALAFVAAVGPSVFLARRGDGAEVTTAASGELLLTLVALPRALAIIALIGSLHRWFVSRSARDTGLLLFAFLVNLVANFPLAIPRFVLFSYLFIATYVITDVTKPRFKFLFFLAMLFGLFVAFPGINYFQRGGADAQYEFSPLTYFATHGDFDGFQSTINVVEYVNAYGISWGYQFIGALLFFVPRSIWPTKPIPTGIVTADHAGYLFTNISSPFPSEAYINFGYIGAFIFGAISGYLFRRLDDSYVSGFGNNIFRRLLIYGGFSGYIVIISRGTLQAVMGPIAVYFTLSYILSTTTFTQLVRVKEVRQNEQRTLVRRQIRK